MTQQNMLARRVARGWRQGRSGFTLIEVMIAIAIVLAIATLVGINLLGSRDKATKGLVKIQMDSLKQALNRFKIDFERYPTDEEGLKVLWDKTALSSDAPADKYGGPYTDRSVPVDNWGTPWGYKQVGEKGPAGYFDLWSYGPDKQDGTEDDLWLWSPADSGNGTDSTTPGGPPPMPVSGGSKSGK